MATATARMGDPHNHGGMITSASSSRKLDGHGVARVGDTVSCPIHGNNTITTGSSNVMLDGKAVARVGSLTACGATITAGSTDCKTS